MEKLQIKHQFITKLIILFVLLFAVQNIFSQVTIRGKVIDSITEQPIPYASVFIENSGVGTISNNDGIFILNIQDTLNNKNVTISCLGYKKKIETLNTRLKNNIIRLSTVSTMLSEVNVVAFNETYLFNLIQNAIDKKRIHGFIRTKSKCYVKILTSDNKYPVEMIEALGQATINNIDGLTGLILKTGRIAYSGKNNNKFFNFEFTKTISGFSAFRKNPKTCLFPLSVCNLSKNKIKKEYAFKNPKIIQYNSEKVLKIDCINKNRSSNHLNANLLIGLKSHEIYSLTTYGYVKNNTVFIPLDDSHKIDSLYIKMTLLFKNHPDDSIYLRHLTLEYKMNYYDTITVRKISSKMFVNLYDYNDKFYLPKLKFCNIDNDYIKLLTLHFDSEFWHKNYFSAESNLEKKYKNYLMERGIFVNYNKFSNFNFLKTDMHAFLIWSRNSRLAWGDINHNSICNPVIFSKSISYKNRQFDEDLYNLDFQIYLDIYKIDGSLKVYTETLFSKNTSFYYLDRNADVLDFINLYFDIYEATRKKIAKKINSYKNISISTIDSIYNEEMENLDIQIKQFKKEVNRGRNKEEMKKWSDHVNQELISTPNELLIGN